MVRVLMILSLLVLPLVVFADPPYTISAASQYARVGGAAHTVAWSHSTSSSPMRASATNSATPLLVSWDSMTVICSSAAVNCAWTMSSTPTLGSASSANQCEITDSNSFSGPAACISLPAAGCVDDMPQLATLRNSPGARSGVCSTLMYRPNMLAGIRAPCRVDGDCTDAGHIAGTTCNTSPSDAQLLQSGAFLICRAPASGTIVSVRQQR